MGDESSELGEVGESSELGEGGESSELGEGGESSIAVHNFCQSVLKLDYNFTVSSLGFYIVRGR